jgi:PAS domain S-box-containing protein
MGIFRNMSLYTKVLSVMLMLSMVAGAVTWRGIDALTATNSDMQTVYDQRVTPLRHLKIVSDMYAVNIVDASHKARNGNQAMSDSLVAVNDAQARINASWTDYVKGVASAKEKALIADVDALKKPADEMSARLASALAQNDATALDALVRNELYQIVDPLTGKVSELIDLQVAEAGSLLDAGSHAIAAVSREVLIVAIGGITVAMLTALWVLGSAVRRLRQSRDSIQALASGSGVHDRAAPGAGLPAARDEVGLLMQSLQDLQARLAADMRLERDIRVDFEGKQRALDLTMAVIETRLDGSLIRVNDIYLNTMGFTQEEVAGKHHRIFVDPATAASPAYAEVWDRLARGESFSAKSVRATKTGAQVWWWATYTPVLDADGNPNTAVIYAQNITEEHNKALEIEAALQETSAVLGAVAEGDLSQGMVRDYSTEFVALKSAVNRCVDNLRQMVGQIRSGASSILSGAREIAQGNSDLSQRTEQQASSLEETASSMEQLTSTVKQNADNARQADQLAADARKQAEQGGAVVNSAVTAMSGIEDSSKRIADIIGVIDEIAFQTNLLALNAAVEAARAGEQGRGFAVVASEVRNLAQRSAGAAKEIKGLINDSVERVGEGSRLVDASGKTLSQIVQAVKKVSDIIGEIATASHEQSAGIEQVNRALTNMDQATQQNAALVEEAAAASESMDEQARALSRLVSVFRTGEQDAAAETEASPETPAPAMPERRSGGRPWSGKQSPAAARTKKKPTAASAAPAARAVGDEDWQEF